MDDRQVWVDLLVRDADGQPVMAVEVKGHSLGSDLLDSSAWSGLLSIRAETKAPFGLLFSPGACALIDPQEATTIFSGQDVLDVYGISKLPRYGPESIVTSALHTWLTDLTLGIARPQPTGFPPLYGDHVRQAA